MSADRKRDHDDFLDSMTFALPAAFERCSCCDDDECGMPIERIPQAIRESMERFKRQKQVSSPSLTPSLVTRSQNRELVTRLQRTSIWKVTMPMGAEPLVEWGNSPRIIYVDTMASSAIVKSIGNGIVGSSDETGSRSPVHWKQSGAYFIPANGGKAVGWLHAIEEETTSSEDDVQSRSPIVLYWIKLPPPEKDDDGDDQGRKVPHNDWVSRIRQLCEKEVKLDSDTAMMFSGDIAQAINEMIKELEISR